MIATTMNRFFNNILSHSSKKNFVNKSIITNQSIITFVVFDVNDDIVSINFIHFISITTFDDINSDAVAVSIISNGVVLIDFDHFSSDVVSINFDHFAICFDHFDHFIFITLSFFENFNEKLSIFFSKIVYIVFSNESNNECDDDNAIVKKKIY